MSVEERVGQVFLVTFQGDTVANNVDIAELIVDYRIGGVALLAENDNISGYGDPELVPIQVAELNNQLQRLALSGQQTAVFDETALPAPDFSPVTPIPPENYLPIPLFIATNHEGNGYPYTEILHGLTALPSNMAIGATWEPAYAQRVGEVVGSDLTQLGINMLFGPSLDVLENPATGRTADLGVRSFGGDPYWVGLMGRAYTAGIHAGSENQLAVIAKHFPGNGSSDRPVSEEVPTVRKSLEQLKQIELAPFFAVTGLAMHPAEQVDGLLTTHIRYQGFQGNIRATTVPVSFDPQALTTLMELNQFAGWRQAGGVIVSDALGVRSVEQFYDDTGQEFPHRRVAKDAFLAGNDILYLADFALGSSNYSAEMENVKDTIKWFREKYVTDPSFQLRVDEAVLRILQLKLRLYGGDFSPDNVLRDVDAIPASRSMDPALLEVSQAATTLISPSAAELAERLATPPGVDDQIIIFTDEQRAQQCSTCAPEPMISHTALQERILALYGPQASAQIRADQIRSFTFADLAAYLQAGSTPIVLPTPATPEAAEDPPPEDEVDGTAVPLPTPTPPPEYWVQEWLRDATWIIFAIQGATPESQLLNRILAERTDLLRDRKVLVFAYDAPYLLDSTETSKLTAYYGFYHRTGAAIDASARALFQELPVAGTLPISVPGINYDLFRQTQPDPAQVLELYVVTDLGEVRAPPSEEPLDVSVGDTLRLQTGVIRDRNGHQVPDGTLVAFIQQDRIQGLVNIIANKPTVNGIATLDYVLEARTGQFRITAAAGDAEQSQEVDIIIAEAAQVAIITPTPAPTATPTPTPQPTSTPQPTPTFTPEPSVTPTAYPVVPEEPGVNIPFSRLELLASLLGGLLLTGGTAMLLARTRRQPLSEQIGWMLWALCGGLLVYNYFSLGLPGTAVLHLLGSWAGLATTAAGGLIGLLTYQIAQRALQ
ncbi:MAG: hypothetical protein KC425_23285 [Anaerolineales bacterium]|nr:hypothetical protein [Anaerolineales bacterium]